MLNPNDSAHLKRIEDFASAEVWPVFEQVQPSEADCARLRLLGAQAGVTGIEVPSEYGGLARSFGLRAAVCQSLAKADFGIAMSLINTHNVAQKLVELACESDRAQCLPELLQQGHSACTALTEPGAGSDFAAITTRAQRIEGGWQINGEKTWIINARHASWSIVYAQCGNVGDRDGIGAFLIDLRLPGCERYALESSVSQTSMGTGGFRLTDVHVSDARCLIEPGHAFRAIMAEINHARAYVAAMSLGMLESAIDTVRTYGSTRHTFGRPLNAHQHWRMALAQADTEAAAVRSVLKDAVQAIESLPAKDPLVQKLAAQAKLLATQTNRRHLPLLLHALGSHGLSPRYPIARHCAAMHMASLTDGSDEMLLERVAAWVSGSAAR